MASRDISVSDILVAVGAVAFVGGGLFCDLVFGGQQLLFLKGMSKLAFIVSWASVAGGMLAAGALIWRGVRFIHQPGSCRRRLAELCLGVLLCGVMGFMRYDYHRMQRDALELDTCHVAPPSVDDLQASSFGPDKASELSRSFAAMEYVDTGKIVEHLDTNGTRQQYIPTAVDRKKRRERVDLIQALAAASRLNGLLAASWLVVLVGSAATAWLKGVRSSAAQPADRTDAAR